MLCQKENVNQERRNRIQEPRINRVRSKGTLADGEGRFQDNSYGRNREVTSPVEDKVLTHKILYIPECPISLLGRDLLYRFHAQITFSP